jgi:hypothetical protein
MNSALKNALLAAALLGITGCSYGSNDLVISGPVTAPVVETPDAPAVDQTPVDQTPAPRCDVGRKYVGLGGLELTEGRADLDVGLDRGRVKPFTTLQSDYGRVLGNTPALLTGMGPTFGEAPNRWYQEPQASAISLYTAYRIAFQGCLTHTATATKWSSVPNASTAEAECIGFAEKFWNRSPATDELSQCVQIATVDSQIETDPRRRWAYACAGVLSSAGFLTY